MSIAQNVERARPAFGRDVAAGLDALEPLIGRIAIGSPAPGGARLVTSALRTYRFDAPGAPASGLDDAADERTLLVRAAVPAGAVGALDALLRECVEYARTRHLYGGTVLDIPHARSLLAAAVADALIADALGGAAVRLADAGAPAAPVAAGLSAHLTCLLLAEASQQLSVLAGSTFYARISPFELIEQHVRDLSALPALVPGLADALPSAPAALHAWGDDADAAAPGALLRPEVAAAIASGAPGAVGVHAELAAIAAETAAEVRAGVPAADDPASELAHRVALITAAAAVVDGWAHARGAESIAADPLALEACLRRIRGRLGRRQPPLPADLVARLVAHAEALTASADETARGPARATASPL